MIIQMSARASWEVRELLTGFIFAKEELDPSLIAMMAADMTYDPKDIPARADMIIGLGKRNNRFHFNNEWY